MWWSWKAARFRSRRAADAVEPPCVTDYRNLSAAVLEPAPQLTVLCGANGQGKTNLLEAVWLLTGGKSFRGAKDAELIRRGADFAVLEAAFEAETAPRKYG